MEHDVFRLDAAGYAYNKNVALKDINLSIRAGESLAVVGANGSGKSTLLKMLDGLVFPTSGSIKFMGAVMTEDSMAEGSLKYFRERVGFVFAEPDVQLFCPTVYDEVAFGPLQLDLPEKEVRGRVDDLLSMLGITRLSDRAPYSLSSGEKKKVAIAAVLALNPDVLLLDEPTNALDPRTQVWLFELIAKFKALKKTFVIATHDLSLAADFADRVAVLDESHTLLAQGPALKVLEDKALLLRANIIHEHVHRHGRVTHIHSHGPYSTHDEHD